MDKTKFLLYGGVTVFVVGQLLDLFSTWLAVGTEGIHEANVVMLFFFQLIGVVPALFLTKIAFTVLVLFLIYYSVSNGWGVNVSGRFLELSSMFSIGLWFGGGYFLLLGVNNLYLILTVGG